jgi:hypothetical protein
MSATVARMGTVNFPGIALFNRRATVNGGTPEKSQGKS